MIRTNLSTRPFYNERAVHLWLLLVALAVAAVTVYNVSRVVRYSRSDQRLATQAALDETRAADLRRQAAQLRATVDPRQVELASIDARLANELIDRRTFSWTELLNRLETTLPDDVHVVAIRPRLDRSRGIVLQINLLSKSIDDTDRFIENMEATGAFKNPLSVEDHVDDQGLYASTVDTGYTPATAKAPPEKGAAPSTRDDQSARSGQAPSTRDGQSARSGQGR